MPNSLDLHEHPLHSILLKNTLHKWVCKRYHLPMLKRIRMDYSGVPMPKEIRAVDRRENSNRGEYWSNWSITVSITNCHVLWGIYWDGFNWIDCRGSASTCNITRWKRDATCYIKHNYHARSVLADDRGSLRNKPASICHAKTLDYFVPDTPFITIKANHSCSPSKSQIGSEGDYNSATNCRDYQSWWQKDSRTDSCHAASMIDSGIILI